MLKPRRQYRSVRTTALVIALVGTMIGTVAHPPAAQANSALPMPVYSADFRAGNLISDGNFYNGRALAEEGVQALLDAKVPTCVAGATCLPDFTQTTPSRAADGRCAAYAGGAAQSAARIIARVGLACGISQEVLLALIQKETSLVAATAPTAGQYARATGYGCPDGSACDPAYAGFFNQVHAAAWQFKSYLATPTDRFAVGKVTSIAYSPDASLNCGAAGVLITNNATAALYRYTPFQPNAAALKPQNFFLKGDQCSSRGNRDFWAIYNGWFGASTVDRLDGADRFSASADISAQNFATGIDTVYVTNGLNFPDALSGAPVAARDGSPILLVLPDVIPDSVVGELERLQPRRIVILGGPDSVSPAVEAALTPHAQAPIERLFGPDRFSASADISSRNFPSGVDVAYVTNGYNFPDALSGAPVAAKNDGPVLLVAPGSIPESIRAELVRLEPKSIVILGGVNSVSTRVEGDLRGMTPALSRFDGPDRFAASADISEQSFPGQVETVYVANGLNFPDALSGAPVAARDRSPILLVSPTSVPALIQAELDRLNPTRIVVLGGINSVSAEVARQLARSIR